MLLRNVANELNTEKGHYAKDIYSSYTIALTVQSKNNK